MTEGGAQNGESDGNGCGFFHSVSLRWCVVVGIKGIVGFFKLGEVKPIIEIKEY
jgi:hypothetical protein